MDFFARVVYIVVAVLGLLIMGLACLAMRRSRTRQVAGRLLSTALWAAGMSLSAGQRATQGATFTVGLPFVAVGMALFVAYLPDTWPNPRRLRRRSGRGLDDGQ